MAILSTYTPQTFAKVVESNDIKSMQRVPGIGPKKCRQNLSRTLRLVARA